MGAGAALPQRSAAGGGHQEDHRRGPRQEVLELHDGLALLKNYQPFEAPPSLALIDLWRKFDKSWGSDAKPREEVRQLGPGPHLRRHHEAPRADPWNFLFIAGMWFQDLFNYDFRRTEMCIIPYATQQGEISFCAYNTGIGWRKIIENMYKNATVAEWYKTHGKHEIYAKGREVNLNEYEHSLTIDAADAARVREREHDIPMTAAEEDKARRRKASEEAAKVRAIYEEMVLKKPQPTVVQIGSVQQIKSATGPALTTIAPANGHSNGNGKSNGNGNGNGKPAPQPAHDEEVAAPAGD